MTAPITKRSREESGNESFFPTQKLPRTAENTTILAQANLSSSSNSLVECAIIALQAEVDGGEIEEASTEQSTPASINIPKKEKRRYSCETCNWSTVQPSRMNKHRVTHKQNSDINISFPTTSSIKEGSKLPEIYRNQAPLTFTLPPINAASSKVAKERSKLPEIYRNQAPLTFTLPPINAASSNLSEEESELPEIYRNQAPLTFTLPPINATSSNLSEEESELPENWDQAPLTFTMPQKNAASSKVAKERSKLPEIYRNQAPLTFTLPQRRIPSISMVEDLRAVCNKIAKVQATRKIVSSKPVPEHKILDPA